MGGARAPHVANPLVGATLPGLAWPCRPDERVCDMGGAQAWPCHPDERICDIGRALGLPCRKSFRRGDMARPGLAMSKLGPGKMSQAPLCFIIIANMRGILVLATLLLDPTCQGQAWPCRPNERICDMGGPWPPMSQILSSGRGSRASKALPANMPHVASTIPPSW